MPVREGNKKLKARVALNENSNNKNRLLERRQDF